MANSGCLYGKNSLSYRCSWYCTGPSSGQNYVKYSNSAVLPVHCDFRCSCRCLTCSELESWPALSQAYQIFFTFLATKRSPKVYLSPKASLVCRWCDLTTLKPLLKNEISTKSISSLITLHFQRKLRKHSTRLIHFNAKESWFDNLTAAFNLPKSFITRKTCKNLKPSCMFFAGGQLLSVGLFNHCPSVHFWVGRTVENM